MDVRLAEDDDVKYIWAAYRLGAMEELSPIFRADMGKDDFRELLVETLNTSGNTAWIISAPVPGKGVMPIGVAYGLVRDRIVHDLHKIWFPWASKRSIFEGAVVFFERMRREFFVKVFADQDVEKFYDAVVKTGALKRGCRFHGLYPGKAAIFYYAKV